MQSNNSDVTTDARFARKQWALQLHPDKNPISDSELKKRVDQLRTK
jgi:hypothetical protein